MKDVAKGIGAMVLALVVFSEIPIPNYTPPTSDQFFSTTGEHVVWAVFVLFVSAGIGSFVANTRFVLPSILVWAALTALSLHTLKVVSDVVVSAGYAELAAQNAIGFGASLLAAVMGALTGDWLRKRSLWWGVHAA